MLDLLAKCPMWLLLLLSSLGVIGGDYYAKYWSLHRANIIYF